MHEGDITPDQRLTLDIFCKICDDLSACGFMKEFRQRSGPIIIQTVGGRSVVRQYREYDREDVRSFAIGYRKLRLDGEHTRLASVIGILWQVSSEDDKKELEPYQREIRAEAKSWSGVKLAGGGSGEEQLLTAGEIENLLFNAELFHTDKGKQEAWKHVEKYGPIWEHAFLRFAATVVFCASRIAQLIRLRGYNEPIPSVRRG